MKKFATYLAITFVLSACQKDEIVHPQPEANQITFTIEGEFEHYVDGEFIYCTNQFYWSGANFSADFGSSKIGAGYIDLQSSHFLDEGYHRVGDGDIENRINIWIYGKEYSTYNGFASWCEGSGNITIDEVTSHYIKGSFECEIPCGEFGITHVLNFPIRIRDGKFVIRRY